MTEQGTPGRSIMYERTGSRRKPKVFKHGGTGTAYANCGCRCEECTEANRVRIKRRRQERFAEPKDPNDPRHGKTSFYSNHGCRCEACSKAWSEKCKAYNAARKA